MNIKDIYVGQTVTHAGYPGAVKTICEWSRTDSGAMVEVQLGSGLVCVSCHDLRPTGRASELVATPCDKWPYSTTEFEVLDND